MGITKYIGHNKKPAYVNVVKYVKREKGNGIYRSVDGKGVKDYKIKDLITIIKNAGLYINVSYNQNTYNKVRSRLWQICIEKNLFNGAKYLT